MVMNVQGQAPQAYSNNLNSRQKNSNLAFKGGEGMPSQDEMYQNPVDSYYQTGLASLLTVIITGGCTNLLLNALENGTREVGTQVNALTKSLLSHKFGISAAVGLGLALLTLPVAITKIRIQEKKAKADMNLALRRPVNRLENSPVNEEMVLRDYLHSDTFDALLRDSLHLDTSNKNALKASPDMNLALRRPVNRLENSPVNEMVLRDYLQSDTFNAVLRDYLHSDTSNKNALKASPDIRL